MPLLLGLVVGFLVFTGIWAFVGPFVALLNLLIGRFFIASVLMAISLWSETILWSDFHVGADEYKVLLAFGLILEGVKWVIKRMLTHKEEDGSEQGWDPIQTEVDGDIALIMSVKEAAKFAAYWAHRGAYRGGNVIVNVVDDPPAMKDITPRVRRWLIK
jgi:hypothetical protein